MKKIFLLGLVLCVVQSQAQISPIQREVNGISPGQFIKEKLFAAKPAVSISFLQDLVTE